MTVMSQNSQTDALLAHVVSQLESNLNFLISQKYIRNSDAAPLLNKLKGIGSQAPSSRVTIPTPSSSSPTGIQARALWAYNENGEDPEDLSFGVGDIIDIIEETNADWWMGRVNGRQALFPSSYVEKIPDSSPAPRSVPPAAAKAKPAYKPFRAAHSNATAPPPPGAGVNSVGLQQEPGQEQKSGKYSKYGDTMAHSAAGGAGFAIGTGIVRRIF